jgi:hypothetical protein
VKEGKVGWGAKRLIRGPRHRWENSIKMYLKYTMGVQ